MIMNAIDQGNDLYANPLGADPGIRKIWMLDLTINLDKASVKYSVESWQVHIAFERFNYSYLAACLHPSSLILQSNPIAMSF